MTTKEKIEANRKNATHSTGPRTAAGKARSANNSTRHGLLGKFVLLEGEDPKEFAEFEQQTRAELKPEGAVENSLVDRWCKDTWRLNRLDNAESALLENKPSFDDFSLFDILNLGKYLCDESRRRFEEIPAITEFFASNSKETNNDGMTHDGSGASSLRETHLGFAAMMGLEVSSLEELATKQLGDRLRAADKETRRAESTQVNDEPDRAEGKHRASSINADFMARAFARKRDALGLLLRYRTKTERSRDNALHELQRLQAARQGQTVAPPELVDVNVNFNSAE
jgi:hypothetical protein